MPKLPDATNLNQVAPVAARSSIRMPTPDYQQAGAVLGDAVGKVGRAAETFLDERQKRAQAQERFDTRMGLLTAEQQYFDKTKDLDPLDPQYVQKKQQARKDMFAPVLSSVKDPENRQYFDASTYEDYIKISQDAEVAHKTARGKKAVFDVDNLTAANVRKVSTGADPDAVMRETFQTIDDSQDLDSLTKAELKQKARLSIATTGLETRALGEYGNLSGGAVLRAVIQAESSGDPSAVSPTGARGLMQVQPQTAADIAVELKDDTFLQMSEKERLAYLSREDVSIRYGTFYLNKMLKRYNGDLEAALIGYNAGPGNADKWIASGRDYNVLPKQSETQPYVQKIFSTLGVDATTAKQDPRLLANQDDVRSSIKSDPLFMQLPVDEQDKLLTSLDATMKKAADQQQKYIEQGLSDAILVQSKTKDPATGEDVIDPQVAYELAKQIPDPATRKSVLSSIDAEVRRQESIRKAEQEAAEQQAYDSVVKALGEGNAAAAKKVIDDANLPVSADKSLREMVEKGLQPKDDEPTKQQLYGLYMQNETGFLEATSDLTKYWGKLTFSTVMDLKEKRDKILKGSATPDKTEAQINTITRSASSKIDDRLREIGVDPNAKAGQADNKYSNFIRSVVLGDLEAFAKQKSQAGQTPLDSEIDDIVKSAFKSYPRAKAKGGLFGWGADKDVDILEVSKEYESAGANIDQAADSLRRKGKPVNAGTLLQVLEIFKNSKAQ